MGADTLVSFEAGKLTGADVILLDEGILGDPPFPHGFPQIIVRNQYTAPFLLDILTEYGV